jgi:capsular polysaccharide biosynthesis protein
MTSDLASTRSDLWRRVQTPSPRRVAFALLAALVVAGLFAASEKRRPPEYLSVATMVIDQPNAIIDSGTEGIIVKLNQLIIKYAALMRTLAVTEPVAKRLNVSPGLVAGSLEVAVPGNSLVMAISSRTGSPKRSQDIANAMSDELASFLKREQDAAPTPIPESKRIVFRVVSRALPGVQVAPTDARVLAVGSIAGAITLVGVYLGVPLLGLLRRRR